MSKCGIVVAALATGVSMFAHAAPAVSTAERAERVLVMQKLMQQEELKFEKQVQQHDPVDVSTRDLPNAALLILRANGPVASAEKMLRDVFAAQNMKQDSPDYGNVPWRTADPSVKDANAIEFTMQPMAAIFYNYGKQFSPAFRVEAEAHLRAVMIALAHHPLRVTYTNIFLMNTVNTMLLAQYLHDDASMERAQKQWQDWVQYTQQNNIHEFNSPTYYATDLADLTYGILYVKDEIIRRQMQQAAELIWQDIGCMFLKGDERLAGAHSRDYQFLTGRGSLEMNLYLEGLFTSPDGNFTDPFLEKVAILENERPGGFHPSKTVFDINRLPERIVQQRADANPAYTRYTYLTQSFAVGTATGSYKGQDKMFSADLVGGKVPPVSITVVPDSSGSPYGVRKQRDRSGHNKPTHLPANLSSAQEKGVTLLLFDLDPRAAANGESYATNLILPAQPDQLLLDGKAVPPASTLRVDANLDSVIAVRVEHSCFAARIFAVESLDGRVPSFTLQADKEGWSHNAIRFAIQHSATDVKGSSARHLHVAMLVEVSPCDTSAEQASERLRTAQVRAIASPAMFTVTASVGKLRLEVAEDLTTRLPVHRKVNGVEMESAVFKLNGKSILVLAQ
ncbi:MAG TPA: hypothetical protein VGB94_12030 [Acidobacteriaceae bacterium]